MHLLPEQCRAARGLLNWTQDHLAAFAGISRSTIKDFECNRHTLHRSSEKLLTETFESHGVRFFFDEKDGFGIRMIAKSGGSG
jgi:transcriptional regulator with XRE-family HTH domain